MRARRTRKRRLSQMQWRKCKSRQMPVERLRAFVAAHLPAVVADHQTQRRGKARTCLLGSVRVRLEKEERLATALAMAIEKKRESDLGFFVGENQGHAIFGFCQTMPKLHSTSSGCVHHTVAAQPDRMIASAWRSFSSSRIFVFSPSRGSAVSRVVRLFPGWVLSTSVSHSLSFGLTTTPFHPCASLPVPPHSSRAVALWARLRCPNPNWETTPFPPEARSARNERTSR